MRRYGLAAVTSAATLVRSSSAAELLVAPRDEVRLRQVSAEIAEEAFGSEELWSLAEELSDAMHAHNGLGLSAIQIGTPRRIFVVSAMIFRRTAFGIDGAALDESIAFCNPEIVSADGAERGSEGCLSFPGAFAMVEAPRRLVIRARDPGGQVIEGPLVGLPARCFFHELQHLDGKLLTDRLGALERRAFVRAVKS